MNQGGDRGKGPNVTGTQPNRKKEANFSATRQTGSGSCGAGFCELKKAES